MIWGQRSLRTKEDVLKVKNGDSVVLDNGFDLSVTTLVTNTASRDVLIAGVVRSFNHPYDVPQGVYIYWGPRGMALSFLHYETDVFVKRR